MNWTELDEEEKRIEIEKMRLLNIPRRYTIMTNEEFLKIKEGFADLQSQLDKSNNKIEKIKEYIKKNRYSDGMHITKQGVENLLSIIDEENK